MRTTRKSWFLGVLALALTLAACSGGQTEETAIQAAGAQTAADPYAQEPEETAEDTAVAQAQPAGGGAQLVVGECGDLGQCITNPEGKVLYGFTDDTQNADTSACAADCLANWPAWATEGAPQAAEGVDAAKVTTITGTDGATQVAYNGWPLYFYAGDPGAATWNGQGVGDKWYVVNAAGQLVKEAPAAAAEETPALEGQDAEDAYSGTDTAYGSADGSDEAADEAEAAPAAPAPAGDLPDSKDVTLESGRSDPAYGGWYLRTGNNYTLYVRSPARPCTEYDCSGYQRVLGDAQAEDGVAADLVGVSPEGWTTCDGRPLWRRISESPVEITGRPYWELVNPETCEAFVGEDSWSDDDDEESAPAAPAAPPAAPSSGYGY